MDIGQLDYKIPGSLNLGGMIAAQQDIATGDIMNQGRQQQMAQSAAAFPLQQQHAGLVNSDMQQEQQAKQIARQRQMTAQGIYKASIDETGKFDDQKYLTGLGQAGLSEFAQQYQDDVAKRTETINKGNYEVAQADAIKMATTTARATEQSRVVWQGAMNLFQHYPELMNSENLRSANDIKSPHAIDAYANFYNIIKGQGLEDNLDTPEQFLANPSMALQKVHQIANEGEKRYNQALEKQKADADSLRAQADWYRSQHPAAISMFGQKAEQRTEDKIVKLKEDLDAAKNTRNAFGVAELGMNRVERMESLGKAFKDTGKLRDAEIRELATGLNAVLSGSNVGSEHQIEELVPKSARGNVAKIMQWWSNEPQGMDQKKFVDRMMNSIDREKRTMNAQIKREQYQRLTAWDFVREDAPKAWEQVVRGAGVKPAEYDAWIKKGQPEMTAVQEPEGSTIDDPRRALAQKALNDPNASAAHKAAARKILGMGQ